MRLFPPAGPQQGLALVLGSGIATGPLSRVVAEKSVVFSTLGPDLH